MFVGTSDVPRGLAVWLMCGTTNTDADYQNYLDTIQRMVTENQHPMAAAVMLIEPGNPIPDARWRRRIALATRNIPASTLFALTSPSRIVQSVVTAINWLRPPTYQWSVHREFEQSRAWVEAERGERCPELVALLAEARAEARAKTQPQLRP